NKTVEPYLAESLPLIKAPEVHLAGATGVGTSVAVLDTGVDYTLGAFGNCTAPGAPVGTCKVAYEACFATGGCQTNNDHGTNVSGIVVGVAPDTKVLGLDVFRTDGSASYDDIISALNWVVANKTTYSIAAVNMSFGGGAYAATCPTDAVAVTISDDLKPAGITTVAASGNDGYTTAIGAPACAPDAVSVGAVYDANVGIESWCLTDQCTTTCTDNTTAADKVACFSNSASFLTLLAPGSVIGSAGIFMSGTSQAAPHVSGAVAIMKGQNNLLTVDQVISGLTSTGVSVLDTRNNITKPRLDLYGLVSIVDPIISVSPSSFAFIGAEGGLNPVARIMGITNGGAGTLDWSVGSSASWLVPAPTSGTGAGSVTLSVDTTGLTPGTYSANVTITATGALNSPMTVPVTLEIKSSAYSEDFETGGLTKFPWVTGGNAGWVVQSSTIHTGSFAVQSGAITHNGSSFLEVALNVISSGDISFWYKVSSEFFWDVMEFRIDGSLKNWPGYSGEAGWTQTTFSVTPGVHIFRWEYLKDDTLSTGSDAVWLDDLFFPPSNTLVPVPSVSPSSKDFGSVTVGGTSGVQTFTVSNTGTGDLIIGTVSLVGTQFVKENDTCSAQILAPSGTCTMDVKFTPSSTGLKSVSLTIPTNYPAATTAALSGTGVLPNAAIAPFSQNFGPVEVGASSSAQTFTISNSGTADLIIGTVILSGADVSDFVMQNDTCSAQTLIPSGSCTIQAIFSPLTAGSKAANLSIPSNDLDTPTLNAALSGTGFISPPVAAFSESITTGDAPLAVTFSDLSINNPTAWSWDFGGSGSSNEQNPLHTFRTSGTYSVTLTSSNAGGFDVETKTAYITVSACGNQPVRISGVDIGSSVQNAYVNNANEGDTINIQAVDFIEDLTLD
ncbi:MAG: choice-of-anchor D domain-containing protein, partial [Thermodesulfovibrionales bacterium]